MELAPGHAGEAARLSKARGAAAESHPAHVASGVLLLVAAWIGLFAGFLDLGILVARKRFIDLDFYRLGDDFAWLIPLGVTILVLVLAIVLALFSLIARTAVRVGVAVWLLSFVGILDFAVRLPLALWASMLLSAGLATQFARLVRPRIPAFLRLVRVTVPLLAGALVTLMLGAVGGRVWSEHQAVAALPRSPTAARNVLLIVWDTVRADNLSLHGHRRATTPNLERLAAGGVHFNLAFSTSSWTLPSHASVFTGRWPHELRVDWTAPLGDHVPTLAEYLAAHGYETAGFVANVDYCSRETGLARGFAHYEDYPVDLYEALARNTGLGHALDPTDWTGALGTLLEKCTGRWYDLIPRANEHAKNASAVSGAFLRWLKARQGRRRPFFAFLNYNDAHSPNEVPDQSIPGFGLRPANNWDRLTVRHWNSLNKATLTRQHVRMVADIYDDCIFYLDRQLGNLLEELKVRGVLENTLVIITSDHGEHLGDHLLFFHGCSLYRQLVHVPLVIVDRDVVPANRTIAQPVSLRDLPATVVDLLGLSREAPFPGQSLTRFWTFPDRALSAQVETLLMETGKPLFLINDGREPAAKGPMKALVAGGLHYIRSGDGSEELYDLETDRKEQANLAGLPSAAATLQSFRAALGWMLRKHPPGQDRTGGPLARSPRSAAK
jgi:arylsulfatase A-like enzyme